MNAYEALSMARLAARCAADPSKDAARFLRVLLDSGRISRRIYACAIQRV